MAKSPKPSRPLSTIILLAAISGSLTVAALGQGRVFLDAAGNAGADQPTTGNMSISMAPASSRIIEAWIVDLDPGGTLFLGYQLILQCAAVDGPSGSVDYVDNDIGLGGGDSIFINTTRAEWAFTNDIAINPNIIYNETCMMANIFGTIYGAAIFSESDVYWSFEDHQAYLAEFEITASADACGVHTLQWNTETTGVFPFTVIFAAGGAEWFAGDDLIPTVWQNLDVMIDNCTACDVDQDGIRDDACVWCECVDLCGDEVNQVDVIFGDMGGPFGECAPDGVSDSHDRFHALNCFANVDVAGTPGAYPCEPAPPSALNVDAGGAFGSCSPDGVCDGNDAFHALNAFAGTSSCSCPLDPAPVDGGNRPIRRR